MEPNEDLAQEPEAVRVGYLPGHRERADGWTVVRQKRFLRALGETGCVRDACAKVGISSTAAYRARCKSPEFRKAWERARTKAQPTLEQAAFERGVEGWDEPVFHGGKQVGTRRRYSDSLLKLLLQRGDLQNQRGATQEERDEIAHAAARVAGGTYTSAEAENLAYKRLIDKLQRMHERLTAGDSAMASGALPDAEP